MTIRKPTQHNMMRRSGTHDYSRPGIYHITLHVEEGRGHLLGEVIGNTVDVAGVALTSVGAAVEHELLTAITAHYPMITVDAYVIMPEHLHFILMVRDPIVNSRGRSAHLGQVIAGFKIGCNRAFWAITGQNAPAVPAAPAAPATKSPGTLPAATAPSTVPGGFAAGATEAAGGTKGKARYSSNRLPLFAHGYCDVMPMEPGQLDQQRAYIRNNPKSRWLRAHDRARLQPQRGGIDTALTPAALRGYLRRECPSPLVAPDALAAIECRLLLADGKVVCNTYGDRTLLQRRLLPVVCHRKDAARHDEQKSRCLEEAARGAVLVSPRIAKGEQTIIDESVNRGYAAIIIADNGFPPVYHPTTDRIALCAEGRLLLVTPWQYEYRGKNESVTVPFCKTMNCISQALCRLKDDWWQT